MSKLPQLEGLDLAALLSSKVCHDLISPVNAIANGVELIDDGADEETQEIAMDLIKSSSRNALAKLEYARLAYGAAGSAGAEIDTGDAESVARGYFANESKTELEWHGERAIIPKNKVKFLLNLVLIGLGAIPRGGVVKVEIEDPNANISFKVTATGMKARVPAEFLALLDGSFDDVINAHVIQPLYALQLAEAAGLKVRAGLEGESVVFSATGAQA